MRGVDIKLTGFRGGHFSRFYAARSKHNGPGWYVYGRNPAYGDRYVMLCARPDIAPQRHRGYNVKVRAGWRTKAEAQAIADRMNQMDRDAGMLDFLESLGPLHGTEFK